MKTIKHVKFKENIIIQLMSMNSLSTSQLMQFSKNHSVQLLKLIEIAKNFVDKNLQKNAIFKVKSL